MTLDKNCFNCGYCMIECHCPDICIDFKYWKNKQSLSQKSHNIVVLE